MYGFEEKKILQVSVEKVTSTEVTVLKYVKNIDHHDSSCLSKHRQVILI